MEMDRKKLVVNDLLSFVNSQKTLKLQGPQCPLMKSCMDFYTLEEMKGALQVLTKELSEINIHVMLDTLPDDKKAVMDTIFALLAESNLENVSFVSEKLHVPSVSNLYLSLLGNEMVGLKQFIFQILQQQYFEMQKVKSELCSHSNSIKELLQHVRSSSYKTFTGLINNGNSFTSGQNACY